MIIKTSLMRGAALGVLVAIGAGAVCPALAASPKKTATHHHMAAHAARRDSASSEVRELRDEVHALQAQLNAQAAAQVQTQAQVQQASASAQDAQAQIQVAQDQDADATAAVLASIPAQVSTAVEAAKPKTDAFYFKGVKITPGGFLEAANVYRSRALGNDVSSQFNTIPFASSKAGHESEDKFTERQSRISLLVQGNVNPATQLAMYGEFDFQGAAQTANSNESNSFNPRVRHLYATVDWNDSGWHILGGQNWSLATMNSKGITPRNEMTPPQIDGQYIPGFVWARQPQIRLTKDFLDHTLWVAVSAENPQTTFTGTVPAGVTSNINNGTGFFGGDTGTLATTTNAAGMVTAVSGVATATQSLNHVPDAVVKVAYEMPVYGRSVHLEAFGIGREFTDRIGTTEYNIYSGGFGGGVLLPILPGLLDLQGSGLTGKGIGRYGSSQLPDVTFAPNGRIEPIQETDVLAGATLHATKMLDVYAFGGEEHEDRQTYSSAYGYGSPLVNLSGCFTEGGSCSAATKFVEQATLGFWDKIYQGPFGRLQFGVQYSYTERHAFSGLGGLAPIAHDNILYTSMRYYPF